MIYSKVYPNRLAAATLVLLASVASADVLHLKTGGRLEGVLIKESAASFTIDVGMGQVSIARTAVDRVERKGSALSEYRSRLARIGSGGVQAYADLARFASESGLRGESQLMWSRVAALDPNNVEAHLALGHVLLEGRYVDEAAFYRARGYVNVDGRWMTPQEVALLRDREQRSADDRSIEDARRAARDAEERAARAEADAARARADAAASSGLPVWGLGGVVIGGGGYGSGRPHGGSRPHPTRPAQNCIGTSCTSGSGLQPVPAALPLVPNPTLNPVPNPAPTPIPQAPHVRPSSIR